MVKFDHPIQFTTNYPGIKSHCRYVIYVLKNPFQIRSQDWKSVLIPHAGIPQVCLFIKLNEHPPEVWEGFKKACLDFQKQHPTKLPRALQHKTDLLRFLEGE